MKSRRVWNWVASVLLVGSLTGMAHAADGDDSDVAREYFRNGVELLQEASPNYQDAYYQFKLAYEKSGRNWKVLGNLGLCAFKLERDAEAVRYYSDYLEGGKGEISEDEAKPIRRDLLLIRGNMATISITSEVPDLEVSISRVGSSVPVQTYQLEDGKLTLGIRAGTQKIVARYDGKMLEWEPPLQPGQTKAHEFHFTEDAAPVAATPSDSQPAQKGDDPVVDDGPKQGMSGLRLAGFATAGVGLGGVVAGVIFGLSANKKEDEARGLADDPDSCLVNADGDNVCAGGAEKAFNKAQTTALMANIFMIGGGVLTAAGVTMVVLGGNKSSENPSASLQLTPAVTPFGGGISAFGRF